ncbi:hypothetical protein B296_00032307 [Ensete ventricosum]|uniref:Uncharacterized protein n=1 Tax=Ensete ventricosum TaxID=4639 RepID=A0A427ACB4_ENSVE|nr:hypothetical protein B296_00032307 [Ensete ventricosum]
MIRSVPMEARGRGLPLRGRKVVEVVATDRLFHGDSIRVRRMTWRFYTSREAGPRVVRLLRVVFLPTRNLNRGGVCFIWLSVTPGVDSGLRRCAAAVPVSVHQPAAGLYSMHLIPRARGAHGVDRHTVSEPCMHSATQTRPSYLGGHGRKTAIKYPDAMSSIPQLNIIASPNAVQSILRKIAAPRRFLGASSPTTAFFGPELDHKLLHQSLSLFSSAPKVYSYFPDYSTFNQ